MDDKEITKISPCSKSSVDSSSSPLLPSSSTMSSSPSVSHQSIKLIVKSPLQSMDDKTVDCDLTWTVAKLKAQISDIYPNKPSVNDQRLIYSGHLLKNDQILGDILKAPSDNSTYTVHLVCNVKSSSSVEHKPLQKKVNSQQSSNPESSNEMNNPSIQDTATNVTQINSNSESPSSSNVPQNDLNTINPQLLSQVTLAGLFSGYPFILPTAYPWTNFVNQTEGSNSSTIPSTLDVSGGPMSVDQMTQNVAWMSNLLQFQMFQQMYAQYLAQNMSQSASLNLTPQLPDICFINGQLPQLNPTGAASTAPPQLNVNNNIGNNVDAAPAQEPVAPRLEPAAPVAGVRLNPAPAVAADDDEDFVQRDWLDWLSLITRAVVLASFIFLYASFSRFLLVTGLYFFYRLMTGVAEAYNAFLIIGAPRRAAQANQQNRLNNNNNDNFNNNNNNHNEGPNRLQQVMDGNIDNHHVNNNSNNNNNTNSVDDQRSLNEQTKMRLFFLMLKALFSSLIPLQPPPLYPNRG